MIYGQNISSLNPSIQYDGVRITEIHHVENSNYLFLDLILAKDVEPGKFDILFKRDNKIITQHQYELKSRRPNSAQRIGFDNSDVLYLITPDRFANGNPDNDQVDGLLEGLDRSMPYGRHGGDIQGIINHLDYIDDMGFSSIWLNPILENDQESWSYHGYATTDYYKVDPRFGTNEDYIELSQKAKDLGIGIIMDIIVNHCGDMHWWMNDPPFDNWLNLQNQDYQETNHRKTTLVDPYVSAHDRKVMTEGWFVRAMPDLNQNNPFMSTYLIQNSIWWIEYADLAGIRQDTYSYPFRDFMTDWTCAIQREYPNFNIAGEEWVENPAIIAYWQQGKTNHDGYTSCLPSLMDFPLCFALHKSLNEDEGWSEGLPRLYEMLGNDFLYPDPSQLVIFPDNHDMSRIYTQLNEDIDLYKMAMTYILTMRGIPQIYYGTEILMSNPGTSSHGIIRSDFPGGWEGDSTSAFTKRGLDSMQVSTQKWLKDLITWRNETPVVHDGKLMHFQPKDSCYVYFRYDDAKTVMVVLHKGQEPHRLRLNLFAERLEGLSMAQDVLTGQSFPIEDSIEIAPRSAVILELSK